MEAKEKINAAIIAAKAAGQTEIVGLLNEFLTANTAVRKGKVNIWKYTDQSKLNAHPFTTGVYYDVENKVAVASDRVILLESKRDYIEKESSVIINRKGEVVDVRYPRYEVLFDGVWTDICLDREALEEDFKKAKALVSSKQASEARVRIGDYWFNYKYIELILKIGAEGGKWSYRDCHGTACVLRYGDDNYRALFSGLRKPADIVEGNVSYYK